MLVDQSTERRAILEKILRDNGFVNVFATNGLCNVFELVSTVKPDIVLIELESPSRDTLEQVRAIRQRQPTPVIMFAQDQDAQTVHSAVESGVCAYLVDSVDRGTVQPAIALAMATFNAYRKLQAKAEDYRRKLDGHKQIEIAKMLLMQHQDLSEREAYRMLRKLAMDQNQKLAVVAQSVIAKYGLDSLSDVSF